MPRRSIQWPTGPIVYAVQQGPRGPVKIGRTGHMLRRLRALQNGSPVRLRVLAMVPGRSAEEEALFRRFSPLRMSGEWFVSTIEADVAALPGNLATDEHRSGLPENRKRRLDRRPPKEKTHDRG